MRSLGLVKYTAGFIAKEANFEIIRHDIIIIITIIIIIIIIIIIMYK